MASLKPVAGAPGFVPHSASQFNVDHAILADGITVDIRRYGREKAYDGWLQPNVCFLQSALGPKTQRSLIQPPGQKYYSDPGGVVFIPSGMKCLTRCVPGEILALCVTIDAARISEILGVELDEHDYSTDVRDPRVDQCLMRLVSEIREPGFASVQLVESVTITLAVELFRHLRQRDATASETGGKLAGWRLKRLKERIEANLGTPLSVAELAKECGMSVRHLIRTFKNTEGATLSNYIARERIERAKARLTEGRTLVKEIAGECGFSSPAAFSVAFRSATGQTPKEYREATARFR